MRLPEAGLSQRAFERTASGGLLAGVVAPMRYGVKDVDYTPDPRGNPILTQHGKADTLIPWQYITQPPNALYIPTAPEYPQVMQAAEKALLPFAQIDPTATLYSDTFASKGTGLAQLLWSAAQPRFSGRVALLVRHRDG
ncbi:MAG TPA: hypothetical protein VKV73_26825 [Chloroflexota bacterium]|nr:hypothetical protein [Chloroflexota bacterium]